MQSRKVLSDSQSISSPGDWPDVHCAIPPSGCVEDTRPGVCHTGMKEQFQDRLLGALYAISVSTATSWAIHNNGTYVTVMQSAEQDSVGIHGIDGINNPSPDQVAKFRCKPGPRCYHGDLGCGIS